MPRLTPPTAAAAVFLSVAFAVPLGQALWEGMRGELPQALDVVGPLRESRLRQFEDDLREASFVHQQVVPWYQWLLTGVLGRGNEKAIEGAGGWLYFRDDLHLLTGPGILEEGVGGREALAAILDFQGQLQERGVQLLLLITPSKEMVEPRFLARWTRDLAAATNPDLPEFYAALDRGGVLRVDAERILDELRAPAPDLPLYLPRDTHWTPATMQAVAGRLAGRVREIAGDLGPPEPLYETVPVRVRGDGDLTRMLRLPAGQSLLKPMEFDLLRVRLRASGEPFRPRRGAPVLLLGDSFTRVFSDPGLGLGEGAGLAEHLALALNCEVDVIALAGGSASATREALARRPEGLSATRVVIWQVGARALGAGGAAWRPVDLPASTERPPAAEPVSEPLVVVAEIAEVTRIPEEFDYEFCLAVHEYRVLEVISGQWDGGPLWVAFAAIVDFKDTEAHRFEVGTRHRLTLEDVDEHHDLEDISWVDRTDSGRDIYWPVEWSEER